MNKTGIEYLDFSWNPLAMRCTPVSEGCKNCWHLAMANRMAVNSVFSSKVRAAYSGKGLPVLIEKRLGEPRRKRKPSIIGVQFMGDLFHESVPPEIVGVVFDAMEAAYRHTFLILTKRQRRMLEYCAEYRIQGVRGYIAPLPNVWLGITAENQECWEQRKEAFFACPGAIHFLSYEPALGPLRLSPPDLAQLDWVICGGESGPGARPMHPDWARQMRDDCKTASVPFFFKQHGAWLPYESFRLRWCGNSDNFASCYLDATEQMIRVGKKAAGRILDGRVWNGFPCGKGG